MKTKLAVSRIGRNLLSRRVVDNRVHSSVHITQLRILSHVMSFRIICMPVPAAWLVTRTRYSSVVGQFFLDIFCERNFNTAFAIVYFILGTY